MRRRGIAGAGAGFAEKSGGDYEKQITVGMCVIGALVGSLVGAGLGWRGTSVYRAK